MVQSTNAVQKASEQLRDENPNDFCFSLLQTILGMGFGQTGGERAKIEILTNTHTWGKDRDKRRPPRPAKDT